MPRLGRAEFRHQQDRRRQQSFRRVVKKCVLTEVPVAAGGDDRLRNDLRVLLSLRLVRQIARFRKPEIHVLVDEVQEVVSVGARGIAQVDHGNLVAVILLRDLPVGAVQITLGVGGDERHPGRAGVLKIRVQEVRRLADTRRADHQRMHIAVVHESNGVPSDVPADDQSLRKRFAVVLRGCCSCLRLTTPLLRCIWNVLVRPFDLIRSGPPRRTMLAIADCFCLDVVEIVDPRDDGDPAEHSNQSDPDRHKDTDGIHIVSLPS